MTEPPPHRIVWFVPWTWKRRTKIVASLLLLFVGYPLSVGPMVWLHDRGALPFGSANLARVIYAPIRLTLQTELGRQTVGRYIDLWEPPTN